MAETAYVEVNNSPEKVSNCAVVISALKSKMMQGVNLSIKNPLFNNSYNGEVGLNNPSPPQSFLIKSIKSINFLKKYKKL